ncbi:hypothetical protein D9619_008344 [Psilocybe cf. subviscida]|uniref:Protein-S-isoprenylcysteine O-methyltransferase n=1 Tax=Psilocybe cf. subviscida TaxID=2480587 RepID=A0A8H5F0F6_9AGAR|nr:hypothetical protein D9619_008344 [Psilocybe cf. subviscida]
MTIFPLVCIPACAYAVHFAGTPPVQAQKVTGAVRQHPIQTGMPERTLAAVGPVMAYGFWAKSLLDAVRAAECAFVERPNSSSPFCAGQLPPHRYLIGWALVMTAALIRRACFREMGRFFTFTVSIQDQHKLIRSGPYSIVRHPGYSAWILFTGGIILLHLDDLPFFSTMSAPLIWKLVGWYNLVYISLTVLGLYSLLMRADVEDAILREHCGQEWINYSREVPDQFIPYVW